MAITSWVLRVAKEHRVCSSCDDWIRAGSRYWFMIETGELFCCDCPPPGQEAVDLCAEEA